MKYEGESTKNPNRIRVEIPDINVYIEKGFYLKPPHKATKGSGFNFR